MVSVSIKISIRNHTKIRSVLTVEYFLHIRHPHGPHPHIRILPVAIVAYHIASHHTEKTDAGLRASISEKSH